MHKNLAKILVTLQCDLGNGVRRLHRDIGNATENMVTVYLFAGNISILFSLQNGVRVSSYIYYDLVIYNFLYIASREDNYASSV